MIRTLVPLAAVFAIACSGGDDTNSGSDETGTTMMSDTQTMETQTCQTDICATYGAAVPTVASQITDSAAADPEFADFFADLVSQGPEAVDAFKASLANYISDAYGCSSGAYTGPSMVEAHTGMGITQQQYDDFITMIAGILASDGVSEDDINYCFAPPLVDPAFEAQFVGL
jgi:truncated hemoglobin YjbI